MTHSLPHAPASNHEFVPHTILSYCHDLIHTYAAHISNIRAALDLLERESPPTVETTSDLRMCLTKALIQAESQRYDAFNLVSHYAPQLIGDLGRPYYEYRSVSGVLAEMLPHYVLRAEMRGIALSVDYASCTDMPPMEIETFAIQRALHNIVSNAIKYSYRSSGSRRRYVRIWYKQVDPRGRRWGLFVQNYGIGVLPHEMSRIFTAGYRGELAMADRTYGCGLGLSEARRCIESHGGAIRFKSVPATADSERAASSEASLDRGVFLTTVRIILPEHTSVRRHHGGEA